ncbi:Cna B-type domain-containing protein [Peptoniphilus sp. oral taxon 386]|uniref:Cna B-type domain-containing protein n=1 Tax=Peptoniphilus sp. oral taxon 386 TaxID=652713 RepID=UPI0001DA9B2B|nr:Cna B-type domain-containing protein [Peptoniphilus sp. oral taxon 386]EFI42117.1 LPXTG-motif cell wall anchor domain protein [Peptoniphilus sp. oral taxon 386 str. F0131]
MGQKTKLQKTIIFFLVFLMLCGVFVPTQTGSMVYAKEVEGDVITEARVTNGEGVPFKPGEKIGAWQPFRVYAKFKLPDNIVKEGDTTTMTLPVGFNTSAPSTFQIKDADGKVIANATLYNEKPGRIVLTYTKYVQEHSGVQGEFYFNVSVNAETQTGSGKIPVTLTVNGKVIPAGEVDYNPPHFTNTQFSKAGWMTGDKTEGKYDIRINQDNVVLVKAKFEDTIQSENVSFIQDSLEIWNGKWENHGSYVVLGGKKDVTQEFKDAGKIKFDGKKLTIDIGDYPESNEKRGFQILYKVKLGYEPVAGEEIKNTAKLTYGEDNYSQESTYKIKDAGGTGEGYVYKIQILKTGKDNTPLAGAKFDVIRVRNNQTVGTITTDSNGSGEIGNLLKDEYKLVETEAPKGYQRLKEPIEVKVSDFGDNKIALKTIENKPEEKVEVSVEKKWVGPAKDSVLVELKKVGSNDVLQEYELKASDNWKHTFTNLPKYENDGTEIKYEVVEKTVPNGYEVSVSGSMENGFIITNKNVEKVDVSVEKRWVGAVGNSVTVQLKKVGDETVLQEKELNAAGNWKHTFKDLDKYAPDGSLIEYRVVEKTVPNGYTVSYGVDSIGTCIIKNTQNKIEVKVTKKWEGITENYPTIKLQLLKNGQKEGAPVELTNGTTTHIWTNLNKTDENGIDYVYTVKEVGENGNNIQLDGNWYKVTYGGDQQTGLTVTNKKLKPWTPMIPPTRDIKVTKLWVNSNGNPIVPPTNKIIVELYKDGKATGKTLELSESNNWSGVFKKLEVANGLGSTDYYKYTVKEVGETAGSIKFDGKWFNVSYTGNMKDGFTITNQKERPWTPMEPPTREVKVTKLWVNSNESPIIPPTNKIIVELYKDGKATGRTLELSASNNWSGVFKNLDVANGLGSTDYYRYTVKEIGENGNTILFDGKLYKVVYGGNMRDGFTITNEKEDPQTPPTPTPNNPTPKEPTPKNPEKPNNSITPEKKVPDTPNNKPKVNINKTIPKTGDITNISLYIGLMLAAGTLLALIEYRSKKQSK